MKISCLIIKIAKILPTHILWNNADSENYYIRYRATSHRHTLLYLAVFLSFAVTPSADHKN